MQKTILFCSYLVGEELFSIVFNTDYTVFTVYDNVNLIQYDYLNTCNALLQTMEPSVFFGGWPVADEWHLSGVSEWGPFFFDTEATKRMEVTL